MFYFIARITYNPVRVEFLKHYTSRGPKTQIWLSRTRVLKQVDFLNSRNEVPIYHLSHCKRNA